MLILRLQSADLRNQPLLTAEELARSEFVAIPRKCMDKFSRGSLKSVPCAKQCLRCWDVQTVGGSWAGSGWPGLCSVPRMPHGRSRRSGKRCRGHSARSCIMYTSLQSGSFTRLCSLPLSAMGAQGGSGLCPMGSPWTRGWRPCSCL